MNRKMMKDYLSHEPTTLSNSYIFLTDNSDLALMIAGSGFGSQALLEDPDDCKDFFSVQSFVDYLGSDDLLGSCRMDYTYVPACFQKQKNDKLEAFFKANPQLTCISGWRLFKNREYLAKVDYQEELVSRLNAFISRHEGPRAAARFEQPGKRKAGSQNAVSDSGICIDDDPDHVIYNEWFKVDDSIRNKMHSFNQKDEPNGVLDSSIVDFIISHVHLFVLDMTVYLYKDGRYISDPHGSQTKELIRSLLYPRMMKSNIMNRIYQQLLDRVVLHKTTEQLNRQPRHWINFRNGFFDVISWKLIEHSPNYYTINQLPYQLDPDWKPPDKEYITEKFLSESITDEDDRKMLWEYLGYAMTTDTGFQKFLTLTGPGGTGKSVVIGMMEDIVSTENISNISLQDLNNRFYPSALHLKLLNSCADIPSIGMQNVDNLKKATGEDTLLYERKGKDAHFFRSYAKLVFSANEIPLNLDEKSDAFYRRLLILRMTHKTAPDKRDTHLREKLAEEWQFILYHSLIGLIRLFAQGHFTESRGCSEAIRELRHRADNVQAFMEDCIGDAPGKRVMRSVVFEAYENYCRENKRQSCGKGRFFERLNEVYQLKKYATEGFCYQDIQLFEPGECKKVTDDQEFLKLEPDEVTPFDNHKDNQN